MAGNFFPLHMTFNNETVSRQNLWAGNIAKSITPDVMTLTVVVYHLQKFSRKSGWKLMEHDFFGLPNGKSPGTTEHLKGSSCFSRWNTPNRSSCSISSKPSLVSVSRLCGRFPVKGTDLYSGKRDSNSRTRFTSPELCKSFTQTVNRLVCPWKW